MVKVVCILAQYTIYYRTSKIQDSLFYENDTLKKKTKFGQNESSDQEGAQETTLIVINIEIIDLIKKFSWKVSVIFIQKLQNFNATGAIS